MEQNKLNNPIIIFGIALLLLVANSYVHEGVELFGLEIKQVDFLDDVRTENFYDEYIYNSSEDSYDDEYDENEDYDDFETENDSALLEGKPQYNLASVINFRSIYRFVSSEMDELANYSQFPSPVAGNNLSGNTSQLNSFFSALKKAKNKQVRVAHYGDSTLEGDLISSDLRDFFQKKFGGKGVGIVPITSHDVNFRKTTDLSFSDDWETASVYTRNKDRLPVGISGHVFVNADGSWVQMKTNKRYKTVKSFDVVKLFYSHAQRDAVVKYSIDGGKEVKKSLTAGNKLSVLEIKKKGAKSIKFTFPKAKSAYYYGVSLESGNGVYVDNYALRGNSGVDLKKIKEADLKSFDKKLGYDLVILEFGLNILSGRRTNFKRYEKDMVKVINRMKKAMPNASFLLVGVHDKCVKKGSKFITDPAVPELVKAQKNIAKKTNIAIWNLFEAMGGENSMVEWVDSNPPKAFKDYIHFNDIGAKEEATMLFNELMEIKK